MISAKRAIQYDDGAHGRARLGFVLLSSEQTIEDDLMEMRPTGVGVHFSRASNANAITAQNLRNMVGELSAAASRIIPEVKPHVVCYACTSGSVVIGEEKVKSELQRGAPNSQTTTLVSGVVAALNAFGVRKISIATPYVNSINAIEKKFFKEKGFDVINMQGLQITDDSDMVKVKPEFLIDFAKEVDRPEAEAVFISCGALRTLSVIEEIEQVLEKPVVCSNQAMMWHCLRLANIYDKIENFGQLFML